MQFSHFAVVFVVVAAASSAAGAAAIMFATQSLRNKAIWELNKAAPANKT
jgi:hypothetical protein